MKIVAPVSVDIEIIHFGMSCRGIASDLESA